jgi:hypothetical protein
MTSPKSPRPESRDTFDTNGTSLGFGEKWQDAGKIKRPSIAGIQADASGGRRKSSILFNTGPAEETIRRESTAKTPTLASFQQRAPRMSSPPPPQTYQRGVSFDTFDNKDATDLSFTLTYKHKDYHNTRRSRTFLCGTDQKDYSEFALEWLIDELVDDGDEIVCLRVVEKDSSMTSTSSVESGRYRDEAQELLDSVIKKNSQDEKAISLIMELAVGRVQDIIQRMVSFYLGCSDIADISDPNLRTRRAHRRHPWPQSGRYARSAARICLEILSSAISHPRHCGPTFSQTCTQKEETPSGSNASFLRQHSFTSTVSWRQYGLG